MRNLLTLCCFVLLGAGLSAQSPAERLRSAQQQGLSFPPVSLLEWIGPIDADMQQSLSAGQLLQLNRTALLNAYNANLKSLELIVPTGYGQSLRVRLVQQELLTEDFQVTTSSGNRKTPVLPGRYYVGALAGDDQSIAAISFFNDEILGVIESEQFGTLELGKLDKDPQNRYALFNTADLKSKPDFECGTEQLEQPRSIFRDIDTDTPKSNLKCVRIYFECEYDMYLANGASVQNTFNYMTGVYNVVKTLYDNAQIRTIISEIFVWNTPDAYPTSSTSNALVSFRTTRTAFNGDVAHLVSRGAPTGGGIAYLDVLCNRAYAYAYSYIYQSYNQFPTYSWTVNVIAHEMGHNLGSPHTHNCSWDVNGDGLAAEMIDGCGPSAGYAEGSCTTAPLPTNGGTVMSYCHLVGGVGINFNHGFGPLPSARIQNRVYNASCLNTCNTCTHTVSITKTDALCHNSATGSATANVSGSTGPYLFNWSNGATAQSISGLSAGTYTVTVTDRNNCPIEASVTILQPLALAATTQINPESAPGTNDGAISVSVSGGTTPYSFFWSNGETTQNLQNLSGGPYSVTITDNNNCQIIRQVVVPTITCTNVVSSFPYTESFESSFGLWEQATDDDFNWLRWQGSTPTKNTGPTSAFNGSFYCYTEADGNAGKTAILLSPCLDFTGKINRSISFACHMNGNQMGSLSLQISTNNGAAWSTIWSRTGNQGTAWIQHAINLDNITATSGTRFRFVALIGAGPRSDISLDAVSIQAALPPCNAPSITISTSNLSCYNAQDGTASAQVSGGTPPYSYLWSNGTQTAAISNLAAGTYSLTVTDAAGCSASNSITVTQPTPVSLSFAVSDATANNSNNGSINLTVSGNTSPYTYLWSNGATTEDLSNLQPGTYSVTVTDAANCTVIGSATVGVAPSCSPLVDNFPYGESFETGLGLWTQSTADQLDWTRNSGSTPTSQTGPTAAADGSFYLYTEATGFYLRTAILDGPCFDLSYIPNPVVSFAYHMLGNTMGSLHLEISTNSGSTWQTLWSRSGNQGSSWQTASVNLSAYTGIVKIRFRGVTGNNQRSDMAIDQFALFSSGSMPEMVTARFSVFPNPGVDQIRLSYLSQSDYDNVIIRLTDINGRVVFQQPYNAIPGLNNYTLPISQLPNGMYTVSLQSTRDYQTQKLIVQH